ncbi:hypothetical protein A2U01_0116319, partial [Trifolium medium]|nr:hypothetical protein [Trifolium medium]
VGADAEGDDAEQAASDASMEEGDDDQHDEAVSD